MLEFHEVIKLTKISAHDKPLALMLFFVGLTSVRGKIIWKEQNIVEIKAGLEA